MKTKIIQCIKDILSNVNFINCQLPVVCQLQSFHYKKLFVHFILHSMSALQLIEQLIHRLEHQNNHETKTNVEDTQLTIVIIGTGISGLSITKLIQTYSNTNINIIICERDDSLNSRAQGYSLTIQHNGMKVLHKMHLKQLITNIGVKQKKGLYYINGQNAEPLTHLKGSGKSKNIYIPREKLRTIIYESINKRPNIHFKFNHNFTHYKYNTQLKYFTVYFENKNPLKCDILIACDGLKSNVRQCFCRNLNNNIKELNYLNVGIINGITSLNEETISIFKPSIAKSKHNISNVCGSIQLLYDCKRMFIKPFDCDKIMWQLTFPLLLENTKEIYEMNGKEKRKQHKIKQRALYEISTWHKSLKRMINDTAIGMLRCGVLYDLSTDLCSVIDDVISDELIFFIGDAIHPMSPFRGQGANCALNDTLEFCEILVESVNQRKSKIFDKKELLCDISNKFRNFHKGMGQRVKKYVLGSRNNVFSLHKHDSIEFILNKYG
eukprot:173967_1